MKKRIVVIFSTHLTELENEKFVRHIYDTCGVPVIIHYTPNFNEFSLSEVYNKAIFSYSSEDAIIVF